MSPPGTAGTAEVGDQAPPPPHAGGGWAQPAPSRRAHPGGRPARAGVATGVFGVVEHVLDPGGGEHLGEGLVHGGAPVGGFGGVTPHSATG
ncbi:MAG: hypothetical protein KGQ66_09245 [Acidobacteriota bacterium]|nr:hypothetical protein [Acidobacteriota bacterium]